MTKEEFEIKKEAINKKKLLLSQELKQIENEYIQSNKKFNVGDKIKNSRNELGIISGFKIIDVLDNRIEPVCKKIRKDGTASVYDLLFWDIDKLELVND